MVQTVACSLRFVSILAIPALSVDSDTHIASSTVLRPMEITRIYESVAVVKPQKYQWSFETSPHHLPAYCNITENHRLIVSLPKCRFHH